VAPWSAQGTVHLDVPDHDGPVTGTMALGDLRFRARGFRSGVHVRATLDQDPPTTPSGTPDGGTGVHLFSGTLDGEVAGTTLRGTWEASAQGGYARRRGTLEAQRR
jgi:hypothetical protein